VKKFARSIAIHAFAIWLISQNIGGISFNNEFRNLILGASALAVANTFLKPLLNIFLLPFNLITLGLFRWVTNVVTLYLATVLVPGLSISAFTFPGFATAWLIIPEMHFPLFAAFIVISFLLSVVVSFIFWLIH
jgi:putative membrane protein